VASEDLPAVAVVEADVPERGVGEGPRRQFVPADVDLDLVILDPRGPLAVAGGIGRLSRFLRVLLHAPMPEAQPSVVLVVRDGSYAAECVASDSRLAQQPP